MTSKDATGDVRSLFQNLNIGSSSLAMLGRGHVTAYDSSLVGATLSQDYIPHRCSSTDSLDASLLDNRNTKYSFTSTSSCRDSLSSCNDLGYHTLLSTCQQIRSPLPVSKLRRNVKRKTPQKYTINSLGDELMLKIFAFLKSSELYVASRVCKKWDYLCWQPALWSTLEVERANYIDENVLVGAAIERLGRLENCHVVKKLILRQDTLLTEKNCARLCYTFPELTHVYSYNWDISMTIALGNLLSNCPKVRHVDCAGNKYIKGIFMPHTWKPVPLEIQYLDLTDCSEVDDQAIEIAIRFCPQLTHLYLRRCWKITDHSLKVISTFCPNLSELSVSDCPAITDYALHELARLGASLRYLSVAKCGQISDTGLKTIAERCYKLRYLNLRGCEAVSDMALVATSRCCQRLRSLDIGKCDITDVGLIALAESCPNLKKLSVRGCDFITDSGIHHVAFYCRGLQQLNIQDCPITENGYRSVKKYCRRCIIEHTNPAFF